MEKNFPSEKKRELVCGNKKLNLKEPVVMGILNLTPDSFYDGGRYLQHQDWTLQAEKMISEGAAIIDLGALSTRPGSKPVTEKEEITRLKEPLQRIRRSYPGMIISVDTYRASVASFAIAEGADIINDISGGTFDKHMFDTVGKYNVAYVIMHTPDKPETMQDNPTYNNIVEEIFQYFSQRIELLKSAGKTGNIILDPGFGFGKTPEHNYRLLMGVGVFRESGYPVMAGLSRKSMINKVLKTTPEKALTGTIALNTIALLNGVDILRVHDVREAVETIRLVEAYKGFNA